MKSKPCKRKLRWCDDPERMWSRMYIWYPYLIFITEGIRGENCWHVEKFQKKKNQWNSLLAYELCQFKTLPSHWLTDWCRVIRRWVYQEPLGNALSCTACGLPRGAGTLPVFCHEASLIISRCLDSWQPYISNLDSQKQLFRWVN